MIGELVANGLPARATVERDRLRGIAYFDA